jgi:hypothetical protein
LQIAQRPDFVSWHRDVVFTCPPSAGTLPNSPGAFDACEVSTLGVGGALEPLGVTGVRTARRLSGGRLLLQRPNLDLVVRTGAGDETTLASAALTPTIGADGHRVAFIQLPAATTDPQPGLQSQIVVIDADTSQQRVVTTDPYACSPWLVPGTDDVIFVSGRTGLASLWIASVDGTERQLTNLGLSHMGKGFVAVPSAELTWVPSSKRAAFTAHYQVDTLWTVDVADGSGRALGPGRLPSLEEGRAIVAFYAGPPGDVAHAPAALHYLEAP